MRHGVVVLMSFGFKYIPPPTASLTLDVRHLPNPYYKTELRGLTGQDEAVADWFYRRPVVAEYLDNLYEKVVMGVLGSSEEDLYRISIGCTGGRHRSVFVAQQLVNRARGDHTLKSFQFIAYHRDLWTNTA